MNSRPLRLVAPDETALRTGLASLHHGDALSFYAGWSTPTCIISDGPYGLGKYPGEPVSPDGLAEWYAPHAAAWAARATPETTLWFWSSEIGWQKSHPALEQNGWQYEECCVWDKGIAHVAGNCNSKTIRGVPVVTEVAVRYTRRALLTSVDGGQLSIKDWVRAEWERSGLPLALANEACGVKNAATRKYLTKCHLWYFPPPEAIVRMADYCNRRGAPAGLPYFSFDGQSSVSAARWERMRSKWNHSHGLTNVWREPPVHGAERIKADGAGCLHANQKPLALMARQILACTEPGDVVWEPFGGLCSATVAATRLGRRAHAAEVSPTYFSIAAGRVREALPLASCKLRRAV